MESQAIRDALAVPMVSDDMAQFITFDAEAAAIIVDAARAYADLLENGQTVEFRLDSDQHWSNTLLPAFNGEGRYLVVRLEEE